MGVVGAAQSLWLFLQPIFGGIDATTVGRLILTLVLCGLVGIERSTHDRAAGFRPHILVGVGAGVMTLAGAYGFADLPFLGRDPLRVASYVVSGIGFLGAGAILRHGTTVRGLTTAASLWIAAGIGIAVCAGLGGLAAVTVAIVLFTLGPLQRLESRLHFGNQVNDLTIRLSNERQAIGRTLAALDRLGVPVRRATIVPGEGTSAVLRVELGRSLSPDQVTALIRRLLTLKSVEQVEQIAVDRDPEDETSQDGRLPVLRQGGAPSALNLHDDTLLQDLDGADRPSHRDDEP